MNRDDKAAIVRLLNSWHYYDPNALVLENGKFHLVTQTPSATSTIRTSILNPSETDRIIGVITQRAIARGFTVRISLNEHGETLAAIERDEVLWGIWNTSTVPAIAVLGAWVATLKNAEDVAG